VLRAARPHRRGGNRGVSVLPSVLEWASVSGSASASASASAWVWASASVSASVSEPPPSLASPWAPPRLLPFFHPFPQALLPPTSNRPSKKRPATRRSPVLWQIACPCFSLTLSPYVLGTPAHRADRVHRPPLSEEHTSELQSREKLVCRLLLEKNNHDTILHAV